MDLYDLWCLGEANTYPSHTTGNERRLRLFKSRVLNPQSPNKFRKYIVMKRKT